MELAVTIDGDDGQAVTRAPVVAGEAAALARDAAQGRPERAIYLQEGAR